MIIYEVRIDERESKMHTNDSLNFQTVVLSLSLEKTSKTSKQRNYTNENAVKPLLSAQYN